MFNYIIQNKEITINEKLIKFEYDIKENLEIYNLLILLIWDSSTGEINKQPFNNIYALNQEGNIIWNIKDIIGEDGLYTTIRNENDNLIAVEFIGMNYLIDVYAKKILGGNAYK